jgi:hypothetical protein
MTRKPNFDWSVPGRTGTNIRTKKVTNTKGTSITKNAAPKLSPEEQAIITSQKKEADRVRRRANEKKYHDRIAAEKKIQQLSIELDRARKESKEREKSPVIDAESLQMLNDMRYVYSKVDGRKKLLKMVKSDNKQFAFMVKELIRLEVSLADSSPKNKGGGGSSNNFFVVLKGLDQDRQLEELTKEAEEREKVDIHTTGKIAFSVEDEDKDAIIVDTDSTEDSTTDSTTEGDDVKDEQDDKGTIQGE